MWREYLVPPLSIMVPSRPLRKRPWETLRVSRFPTARGGEYNSANSSLSTTGQKGKFTTDEVSPIDHLRRRKELLFSISAFVLLFYGTLLIYTTFSKWDAIQWRGQNYLSQFSRVSTQRNIVQIVTDHTQGSLVYEILNSDLERYSEVFDGFTLFTQAAGKYPGTYPSVPFYMTGRAPSVGVNVLPSLPYIHDYVRSLLRDYSFVKTLSENGFHTFAFQPSQLYCQGEYSACTSGPNFRRTIRRFYQDGRNDKNRL